MGSLGVVVVVALIVLLSVSNGSSIDLGDKNNNNNNNQDDIQKKSLNLLKHKNARNLIYGGEDAPMDRYPYTVSLQVKGKHVCGGSLITSNLVLTAAHCFKQEGIDGNTLVVTNPYQLSNPLPYTNESFDIEDFVIHPHYVFCFKFSTYYHDVAIIKLSENISNQSSFVRLNTDPVPPNSPVQVMGWGQTETQEEGADVLQVTNLYSLSTSECQRLDDELMEFTTSDMICAKADGKDSCGGDSGGPLIIKGNNLTDDVQVGIVSFGPDTCASEFSSGVYCRIDSEFDWIRSQVCGFSDNTAPSYFKCTQIIVWESQYPIPGVPDECFPRITYNTEPSSNDEPKATSSSPITTNYSILLLLWSLGSSSFYVL